MVEAARPSVTVRPCLLHCLGPPQAMVSGPDILSAPDSKFSVRVLLTSAHISTQPTLALDAQYLQAADLCARASGCSIRGR